MAIDVSLFICYIVYFEIAVRSIALNFFKMGICSDIILNLSTQYIWKFGLASHGGRMLVEWDEKVSLSIPP